MRWLVLVLAATAACSRSPSSTPAADPVIEDFRAIERGCIQAFNTALRDQKSGKIDEPGLAAAIEGEVLQPWRAMRQRVDGVAVPAGKAELYATLRRYLDERQIAWEAYAAALRAPSDEAARPHYDVYHQKTSEATQDAQRLGEAFSH